MPTMRKLSIGLAAVLVLAAAALPWIARDSDLAAPPTQREAVGQGQAHPVGPSGEEPASHARREKQARTSDPVPRAEDRKALVRLLLLVGLARKQ